MSRCSREAVLTAWVVGMCVATVQGGALAATSAVSEPTVVRIAQGSPALTLDQVVATVLAKNPQVTAAQEGVFAAEQRLVQANAGFLPTVSAVGTAGYGTATGTATVLGPPTSDPRSSGSVSINGGVALYDNGRTRIALDQAQANLAAAQALFRQTAQDVALSGASAFFNVLKAQQLTTVRAAQLEKAEGQLKQAQAQVRAGTAAQADVLQAQAQVAQAQVDLLAARSQIETTKGLLRSVLAMDLFAPLEVQDPASPPPAVTLATEAAVREAEANRPEIAKAVADIAASTAALALAYSNTGFQVSVGLNGTYVISSTTPGLTNTTGWTLGGTISFPLFDGGRGEAAIKEAEANLRAAQAKAEGIRISVRQDAYQAILAAIQARANLEATQSAQAASEAALQAAEGRYRAGVGTILEVTTARAQAAQAEVNAITARYDQQAALATLRHALGRPIVGGSV